MTDSNPELATEIVEFLPPEEVPGRWLPEVGAETTELLAHLSHLTPESRATIRTEGVRILARCTPPTLLDDSHTGLVIGHIQSGKTMSFTTVAALARDNGYRIVVVITGTSVPLFNQSTNRLQRDLRLQIRPDRQWQHFENPSAVGATWRHMQDILDDWRDPEAPRSERQTILITVMKNHRHLTNLVQVLQQLDLQDVPTLVIDDEADQAGLNTQVQQGAQSTTYRCLLALRRVLPHHSYLQYTATPQAPLLINLIDVLSPRFAKVLSPGANYTGGREFFLTQPDLVRAIPATEIPTRTAPLPQPPPSLLYAMQIYFLGVAAGYVVEEQRGNRSMLVHPSQEVLRHAQYFHWVNQARAQWQDILTLPEADPDRQDLIAEFSRAYDDLATTVPSLPPFADLCRPLARVLRKTRVEQVNAAGGRTPQIDWSAAYACILVGGQAMDRGFTVEGLTVTYMPRSVGVGNADTIQQRARFLGYKRPYLGYCRVFLDANVSAAYRRYVEHEEDIRQQLIHCDRENRPLTEWKRAFFLDNNLSPTRRQVLDLDYIQGNFSNTWFAPRAPHDSDEVVQANRALAQQFLSQLALQDDEGHALRTEMQRHRVAYDVPLRMAYEQLLALLRMTRPEDAQPYLGLLLQIATYLESNPDAMCTLYQMSGGRERERALDSSDEIPNLFQGANYDGTVKTYPGDREIRAAEGLTIQIHDVKVIGDEAEYRHVPAVTVWVPTVMSRDWLVQDEP